MTTFTVRTPVAGFTGVVGGVNFTNGAADVDDAGQAMALAYFRSAGYDVTERVTAKPAEAPETSEVDNGGAGMPKRSASTDAWRDYAKASGMDPDEADQMTRDQLVERFATKEVDQ